MIIVDDKFVSDDIRDVCFHCDIDKCFGACCVDGDAGAPLEEEEVALLEDDIDYIKPYMTEKGRREVEKYGVFDYDASGALVTPLVGNDECAYANFEENGMAYCAIEIAHMDGRTSFRKPISCHLYPIRIVNYKDYDAVNFHQWHICKDALAKGKNKGTPIYKFCKDALVRQYGKEWYDKLCRQIEEDE